MQIWLNDHLIDAVAADVSAGGWPSGDGVFETIRTQDGEIFELGRHMRRALEEYRTSRNGHNDAA